MKKIYGTFGVEMRAYGQKLVKFCTHTHTRLSYSSIDSECLVSELRDLSSSLTTEDAREQLSQLSEQVN